MCCGCGCSKVVDVPPPLPVKQRAKSLLSECGAAGSNRALSHAVLFQRHTITPSATDFTSSLDKVIAELNQAAAPKKPPPPKKPPRNVRISSYDSFASCEDAIDGKCYVSLASRAHLPSSTSPVLHSSVSVQPTCCSSSDGMSKNFMSADSSDGTSEYFVSSSHEMSYTNNSTVSKMTQGRVLSNSRAAASVSATNTSVIGPPPLPMKLKHSKLLCSLLSEREKKTFCCELLTCSHYLTVSLTHTFTSLSYVS